MHNSQANKNFPRAICRLGDSWLDVMSAEMRMCLDVQYLHLYVKDGNMKFQSRGEKMDDTSTYRKWDCPDNTCEMCPHKTHRLCSSLSAILNVLNL